jgi:hypothetical protein
MNIPKKEGKYTLNVNGKTIDIVIRYISEKMNRGEMIGMGIVSHIAHYKTVPEYLVKITNSNGDILDKLTTSDEYKYQEFLSSFISKENGATVNPEKISQELGWKFEKDADAIVVNSKFNGIVKNSIKITFYFELRDIYDVEEAMKKVVPYFENLGIKCKMAPKKKRIRSWNCFVASLYLPLDYNLNENKQYKRNTNMNKKLIRLTESDLHRIVKESVKKILREDAGNEYRGVLLPYGYDIKIWGPKIDICLDKKGWSTDEIQRAIDLDAHQ